MTDAITPVFAPLDIDTLAEAEGRVVVLVAEGSSLDKGARRVNRLMKGALERYLDGEAFGKQKAGQSTVLAYPSGMKAEAVEVVKVDKRLTPELARKVGAVVGAALSGQSVTVVAGSHKNLDQLALGAVLRAYAFKARKTGEAAEVKETSLTIQTGQPEQWTPTVEGVMAVAEGVFLTRDLVNEPSNILTTTEFAARAQALSDLGIEVEVLEEPELEKLGMRALLAVGQGSEAPSKVVVMQWKGGKSGDKPVALVGKGVVFDSGGISIKPGAGMEDMTMDMGGAGTVTGVMKTLAMRKAKANVVGLIGLVENMPDGKAQRPGDIVTTMKGDTVEIINTDAEGRMVLCDVLWYAQERFEPVAMVDLATLTGACVIALGHENAGVFSNDDDFCKSFLKAAETEEEGAWRLPLGAAYDKQLESAKADFKHVGGRPAGAITAAQYLQRFVKEGVPWIHLDIAGVADVKAPTAFAPKGATGWGVRALDRMIADNYEG
ncbi:leucyl aminopeptidase [Maritimibacter sp. UBA3975]|uniref:leucyl aminopeptidase n=1 Tax=Maritimibacter sp. UBA3975 TaxID=1946833 RepID=UPI000C0A9FB5|nr:leucyl aminopeptidase [Maritimibacter sp. UBA3975]MAM60177.1 leucyl aminopeptidase [Maritimibacter sp.]|tara:strand:+ start:2222 stop:3697 length:1476 start_codon:yes stop_codon:yes gene_type:complete